MDMMRKYFIGMIVVVVICVGAVAIAVSDSPEPRTMPRDMAPTTTADPFRSWVADTQQSVSNYDDCFKNTVFLLQVQCEAAKAIIETDMPVDRKIRLAENYDNCMYSSDLESCYSNIWYSIVIG